MTLTRSSTWTRLARLAGALGLASASLLLTGCGTRRTTDTARAASEELLLSAATDRAVSQLDFTPLVNKRVYMDTSYFDSVDKGYVLSAIRNRAEAAGVLLSEKPEQADIILEVRCGALGVDRNEYILGIPAVTTPQLVGGVTLPEAALFKSVKQTGAARISLYAYRRVDRRFVYQDGPMFGFSRQRSWWLFGAGPQIAGDVEPEPSGAKPPEGLGLPPASASPAPSTEPASQPGSAVSAKP